MRIFIFQIYRVPSDSMNNTLMSGDYILVNKLAYGARIPITPLSLPFGNTYLDWIELPYLRIFGFSDVQRNDILVFNYPLESDLPIDHRKEYVKRCIAIAGDTIQIRRGIVSVNGKKRKEQASTKYTYDAQHHKRFLDAAVYNPAVFPNSSSIRWNADNFGPLVVPKKGKAIVLNAQNALLYGRVIQDYEKDSLRLRNDSVFINSTHQKTYTFTMDYYFVLGDNRMNSIDSRFWGFVPENHLIGKVVYSF